MSLPNRSRLFRLSWLLVVALGSLTSLPGAASQPSPAVAPDRALAASQLATEVREIASASSLSSAKKEKRISTAVRTAVVAATAYRNGPNEAMEIALDLATAAARAAPRYSEVIINAVAFAPAVARIDAASSQIRAAATAAAKGQTPPRTVEVAAAARATAAPRRQEITGAEPGPRTAGAESAAPVPGGIVSNAIRVREGPDRTPAASLGRSPNFSLTLDASVRHDDNVYLSSKDKVASTVSSVTPGIGLRFGDDTVAHGDLGYRVAFTRYSHDVSPNLRLGSGTGNFGYDDGNIKLAAGANYQQVSQNNGDVVTLGQQAVFRRDVLSANTSLEAHVTPRTSASAGVNYGRTEYKSPGLIGSTTTEVPLNVFFNLTRKFDLSLGYSFTKVNPQLDGPDGKNSYSNIGVRGELTPKLSGSFSAGYRTQQVADNPKSHLVGFEGGFGYEATTNTGLSLSLSRDYSTGALGETLRNSSYGLNLSTKPARQWQFGAGISHQTVDYGKTVFSKTATKTNADREDSLWSGNLSASYLISDWISASTDFTSSRNRSSLNGAEFTSNITSLVLGMRY